MTSFKTIMIGSAGLGLAFVAATPAAAQYYPQPGYGYPQNNGGVVGAIVNAVTGGYGQYPQGNYGYGQVSQRSLVQQCAVAAEQRLGGQYRNQGYNQQGYYGQQGYGYNNHGGGRVLGITSVERRSNGGLRVRGVATSGAYGQQGYGYQNGYGQRGYGANGQADLSFNCKVSARGHVTGVTIARNNIRYNQGYNRGY